MFGTYAATRTTAATGRPWEAHTADPYERKKRREAERQRTITAAGREIGDLPAVANPRRRARATASLAAFAKIYLPQQFSLPWSDDHLKVIAYLENAIEYGGNFALAMPRGNGKTTIALAAGLWATFTGRRKFALLIASTGKKACDLLRDVKTAITTNPTLAEDWPEIVYPIRALDGINQRAHGQLFHGEKTHLVWSGTEIVFPTCHGLDHEQAPGAGAIIRTAGITSGNILGQKYVRPDGQNARPDFVVADDPQTSKSARSKAQTAYRENIIDAAIGGLADPTTKLALVMPCTVIAPGDLADRYLSPDIHPEWAKVKTKTITAWPTNQKLWAEYQQERTDGYRARDNGCAANRFYRKHRTALECGAKVAWKHRRKRGDVSALQTAMNWHLDNPVAFAAEAQNEPLTETNDAPLPEAKNLLQKITNQPAGTVPLPSQIITGFIDVQLKALYWLTVAWEPDFSGAILKWGTYPAQPPGYFTLATLTRTLADEFPGHTPAAAIAAGLKTLTAHLAGHTYTREDGAELTPTKILVDSGQGEMSEVIYRVCRESPHRAILLPSKGIGITAARRPMSSWKIAPGDKRGYGFLLTRPESFRAIRLVLIDTNTWKTEVSRGLLAPPATPGAIVFTGQPRDDRQLICDHLTSETRTVTSGHGRTLEEWHHPVGAAENHLGDCLVGAAAAAAVAGLDKLRITTPSTTATTPTTTPQPTRPRVRYL